MAMATTQRQKTTSGGSVTGLSNALIVGLIAPVGSWFVGRKRLKTISPFFISLVLNFSLLS
jgi:hypothetical protein